MDCQHVETLCVTCFPTLVESRAHKELDSIYISRSLGRATTKKSLKIYRYLLAEIIRYVFFGDQTLQMYQMYGTYGNLGRISP